MNASIQTSSTLELMEEKRLELQHFALAHGLSHPTTLQLSQELDELFNLYTSSTL